MTIINWLAKQFDRETQITRRHLERLPDDKFDWRPHEKSYSAGELASHLVECVRWTNDIFTKPGIDIDPETYVPYKATSSQELLSGFEQAVANGKSVLAGVDEEASLQPWFLKVKGHQLFERPRTDVLNDFTLHHLIHHRGQFSVYLRLLNVAVPGTYGPSADEPM
jgi:uncharacterized damage-inducible protein DinB